MKNSRWSHIKVSRSKPLSSLSLSFQSNNDPFMSSHYSDSARLPKQVIQAFNLTVSCWSGLSTPHSFLLPLLLEEKTQRQGICLTVGSCFMCSVWKKSVSLFVCVLHGGLCKESQESTWGALGFRTGWFVWRSPLDPKGGLAASRFPWNQDEVKRPSQTATPLHDYMHKDIPEIQYKHEQHETFSIFI